YALGAASLSRSGCGSSLMNLSVAALLISFCSSALAATNSSMPSAPAIHDLSLSVRFRSVFRASFDRFTTGERMRFLWLKETYLVLKRQNINGANKTMAFLTGDLIFMRKKFREPCKLVGLYVPLRHMEQMEEIQTDFEIEIKRKSGNGAVPD